MKPNPKIDSKWRNELVSGKISDPASYADFMLGKVSRTFALNIKVLPSKLRYNVLLSYLYCRIADTLEDDKELTPEVKIELLKQFNDLFPCPEDWQEKIRLIQSALPTQWKTSEKWDHLLTYYMEIVYKLYIQLPQMEQEIIARWVSEMCQGMAEFTELQNKGDKKNRGIIATISELDRYCYFVAGTVGNLLCDLFSKHSKWISKKTKGNLEKFSVSFGLGLQLTNILKDVSEDMDRNISFIPKSLLKENKVDEGDLLLPENKKQMRNVMQTLIIKAQDHLKDAIEYTCSLPRLEPRLRLFCLWPLFMALDTLILLAESKEEVYQSKEKLKITRMQVEEILKKTSWICWSNSLIRKFFNIRIQKLQSAFN